MIDKTHKDIFVNVPALDYLTCTTDDGSKWRKAVKQLRGESSSSPVSAKKMQYVGHEDNGVFFGQAEINGEDSFIIDIPGSLSHQLWRPLIENRMRPSRVDVQVTVDLPSWYRARHLVDNLNSSVWSGVPRTAELREDGRGGDTCYIGSAKSDRWIRVYVKANHFVRFEVQYRHGYAERVGDNLYQAGIECLGGIITSEINRLPEHPIWANFLKISGSESLAIKGQRVNAEMSSKLRWLASLMPTFHKMANDHDYGHTVRQMFRSLGMEKE